MTRLISLILLPLLAQAQVIRLDVPEGAHESAWTAALAKHMGEAKDVERRVPYGVADIVTSELVIEVDRLKHIHNALGQAIHYADATGKQPVIAILTDASFDSNRFVYYQKLCARHDIEVWHLQRKVEAIAN